MDAPAPLAGGEGDGDVFAQARAHAAWLLRCLEDAELALSLRLREYQATKPESEEDATEYLVDGQLDLTAWSRDAIVLALPEQILCREDCAGLCPVCGKDLNVEPHKHVEETVDPRWAALSELRTEWSS